MRENDYNKYIYEGPVLIFDKCIVDKYRCETMAISEKKARSNISYQTKKKLNLLPGTHITLPGKIKMV